MFVHVPKAGGTSVERLFSAAGYRILYHDNKTNPGSINLLRTVSPQHMHADLLSAQFRLDRFDAIFMVTRHPLERFRSEYAMRHPRATSVTSGDVELWADKVFKRYLTDPFHLDNHLRPQVEFYLPGAHVYHLEDGLADLPGDFNRLFDCGLPEQVPATHSRQRISGFSSAEVPVSPALERHLRAFYQADFLAFDYSR